MNEKAKVVVVEVAVEERAVTSQEGTEDKTATSSELVLQDRVKDSHEKDPQQLVTIHPVPSKKRDPLASKKNRSKDAKATEKKTLALKRSDDNNRETLILKRSDNERESTSTTDASGDGDDDESEVSPPVTASPQPRLSTSSHPRRPLGLATVQSLTPSEYLNLSEYRQNVAPGAYRVAGFRPCNDQDDDDDDDDDDDFTETFQELPPQPVFLSLASVQVVQDADSVAALETRNQALQSQMVARERVDAVGQEHDEEQGRDKTVDAESSTKTKLSLPHLFLCSLLALTIAVIVGVSWSLASNKKSVETTNQDHAVTEGPASSPPVLPEPSSLCTLSSTLDLYQAVDAYLDDSSPDSDVASLHGWPIGNWCVSEIQDFKHLFSTRRNPAAATFDEDLSQWDVSRAVNMEAMLYNATVFNQDLSTWQVGHVTNMRAMFSHANSFTGQGLETWKVGRVETFRSMFDGTVSLQDVNLSAWDTSAATKMYRTFAESAFNGNIATWDVSKVDSMYGMFWDADRFDQDLSRWNVSQVSRMERMFQGATRFNQDLSQWNVGNVHRFTHIFANATSMSQNLCAWGDRIDPEDTSRPNRLEDMFVGSGCESTSDPSFETNPAGPFCTPCS